jgi:RNA polymerase sigma factor (sigma-70 family)
MSMSGSFEEILKKISPTLKRITHRLNGHFSFFDENDLFQEALEHLWISYQKGVLNDKTDSYVLQGCYFYLKNYLRKTLDKSKLISLYQLINEEGVALEEVLAADSKPMFEEMDSDILIRMANTTGLTEREKEVLSLSLEGMTTREIGQKLGMSHVMAVKIKSKIRIKCEKIREDLGN